MIHIDGLVRVGLPPVSCITLLDRGFRGWKGSGLGTAGFPLLFGDDVVLLLSSGQELQHALGWFAAECEVAPMRVNPAKYEAMVLAMVGD